MTLDEIYGEGVEASFAGACPICSDFVRPGSRILPLAVPLPPDPATLHASRGNLIDKSGRIVRPREHAWIHTRCVPRVPDDLEMARDERREALDDMRRDSRTTGRQRRKR